MDRTAQKKRLREGDAFDGFNDAKRQIKLLLLGNFKAILESFVAEDERDLIVARGFRCLLLAIATAESDVDTSDLNFGAFLRGTTRHGATLLLGLTGQNQLVVRFGCELLGVFIKGAGATRAAEIHFAVFVISGGFRVNGFAGYNTLGFGQIDLLCVFSDKRAGDEDSGQRKHGD